jgi:soluble lytic murein transglycosylase-like protein
MQVKSFFRLLFSGMRIYALIILLACGDQGITQAGSIYSFVDDNGVWHFSNVPTDPRYLLANQFKYNPTRILKKDAEFEKIIYETANRYNLDPYLIKAIIQIESAGIPDARSPKGAMGLMQLMPDTSTQLAVSNPFDPKANILGGTKYFKQLLESFKGNLVLALAAYNAGPENVKRYNGIPPYPETHKYVRNVLTQWQRYRSD